MNRFTPKKIGITEDNKSNPTVEKPTNAWFWLRNNLNGPHRDFLSKVHESEAWEQLGIEQNWDGSWFFFNRLRGGSAYSYKENIEYIYHHNFEAIDPYQFSSSVGFRLVLQKKGK